MKKIILFALLFIAIQNSNAQKITTGIYTAPTSDASIYIELQTSQITAIYAGKYKTIYNGVDDNNFKSEDGNLLISIINPESYKVTNISRGRSDVMTLQLALPKLESKYLEQVDLPQGKAYITRKLPFEVIGNYKFDGDKNILTQLNADGTGIYQYSNGTLYNVKWGVLCNNAGQHLGNSLGGIDAYTLMIYTTEWEGISLQYSKATGRVVINRERYKDKI